MQITLAEYKDGALLMHTAAPEARRFAYEFKPGEYEITKAKRKRSLDANAYCWGLCSQIADAVGIAKEDVYRRNIREGSAYTPMPIREDAIEEFQRIWAGHGTGWFAEVVDTSKLPGYKTVFAYHGSSVYDTKQMSDLLERIIQDARNVGIEVISEREKSLLLEAWDDPKNKSLSHTDKG